MIKNNFSFFDSFLQEKFALWLIGGIFVSMVMSIALFQLFAVLLFIMYLWQSKPWKGPTQFSKIKTAFILYIIVRNLSVLCSEYPESSYEIYYKELLFFLCFFAFEYYWGFCFDKLKHRMIPIFAIAVIIAVLTGSLRFLTGEVNRAQTYSGGYAVFSSFLLASFGLLVPARIQQFSQRDRWLWLIGIIFAVVGMIISQGRANLGLAALAFGSFVILRFQDWKYYLTVVIVSAGLSVLFFQINSKELSSRMNAPASVSDRDVIYRGAGQIVYNHPILGYGPRTFHEIFPLKNELTDKGVGSWHNDLLQLYFESGILGLLVYLWLLFETVRKFIINHKNENKNKALLMGMGVSVLLLFLSSLFAGFLFSPILSILFIFLITGIDCWHPSRQAVEPF